MKNLKKIEGAKRISKDEQKSIKGGIVIFCDETEDCIPGWVCIGGRCER